MRSLAYRYLRQSYPATDDVLAAHHIACRTDGRSQQQRHADLECGSLRYSGLDALSKARRQVGVTPDFPCHGDYGDRGSRNLCTLRDRSGSCRKQRRACDGQATTGVRVALNAARRCMRSFVCACTDCRTSSSLMRVLRPACTTISPSTKTVWTLAPRAA